MCDVDWVHSSLENEGSLNFSLAWFGLFGWSRKTLESPMTPSSREAPESRKRAFSLECSQSASINSNGLPLEDDWETMDIKFDDVSRRLE